MSAADDTRVGWVTDPGHEWLRVPLDDLAGYAPTEYSHRDDRFAYLEGDCDAPAWAAAAGRDIAGAGEIRFTHPRSHVRRLPRFPAEDGPCLCGDRAHADCKAGPCLLASAPPAEAVAP